MSKKVYLASPYSHEKQSVRQARFDAVNIIAADLIRQGHIVFSPISHNHPIAVGCNIAMGWEYWAAQDTSFIQWADVLYVFMQDGWEESIGVNAEISIAKELHKPIGYINKGRLELLERLE